MKRYYISPIDITQDEDGNNLIRVLIAKYPKQGYITEIPSSPTTGLPLFDWAIVLVTGTPDQHQAILADPLIEPIPHNDNPDDEITLPAAFKTKLTAKGVNLSSKESMRTMCVKIGKKLNANFNFERFSVSE